MERDTYNQDGTKLKTEQEKSQADTELFPSRWSQGYPK